MVPMRENARVIVEGVDGSGKTTLTNHLIHLTENATDWKFSYVRNEKGPRDDLDQWWMTTLAETNKATSQNQVPLHDRFFYPELVYGPVLRGKISTDPGTTDYVHRYLQRFAFLIYCRPSDTTLSETILESRFQWPGVIEQFDNLVRQYDKVMEAEFRVYGPRFFSYDFRRQGDQGRLFETLQRYLSG